MAPKRPSAAIYQPTGTLTAGNMGGASVPNWLYQYNDFDMFQPLEQMQMLEGRQRQAEGQALALEQQKDAAQKQREMEEATIRLVEQNTTEDGSINPQIIEDLIMEKAVRGDLDPYLNFQSSKAKEADEELKRELQTIKLIQELGEIDPESAKKAARSKGLNYAPKKDKKVESLTHFYNPSLETWQTAPENSEEANALIRQGYLNYGRNFKQPNAGDFVNQILQQSLPGMAQEQKPLYPPALQASARSASTQPTEPVQAVPPQEIDELASLERSLGMPTGTLSREGRTNQLRPAARPGYKVQYNPRTGEYREVPK